MLIEGLNPRRIGIFSDIHGNLQALERVLEELGRLEVDLSVCCGDVVGYGGNPNECIEALRTANIPTIAGNHDHAALQLIDITYFNEIAKRAIVWTQQALAPENEKFLRDLPLTLELEEILFVHASPRSPETWSYIITMGDARKSFKHFEQQICFVGHTHTPFIVENVEGQLACPETSIITLQDGARYLVNVGSVGQPRDHNPDACFAIYDRDAKTVGIHRVQYDLEKTQHQIREQGLPIELAERLAYGM